LKTSNNVVFGDCSRLIRLSLNVVKFGLVLDKDQVYIFSIWFLPMEYSSTRVFTSNFICIM